MPIELVLPHSNVSGVIYTLVWISLLAASVFRLLVQKREPAATLSWLIIVVFLPIVGSCLFFLMGPQILERRAARRKSRLKMLELLPKLLEQSAAPHSDENEKQILKLARQISDYPLTDGNRIGLLPDPAATLERMEAAIEGAKHFVHLEYYIIASDEVTEQLFSSLERALSRGVEVRILYDAFGSLFLKRRYFKRLIREGARVAGFLPLSPLQQRFYPNFRNHRKLLIVDGQTAFTGGTNIGKEYLGRRSAESWRDITVQVSGPVVLPLQDVFSRDWYFTTQEDLFNDKYFPEETRKGDDFIQVLESGPDSTFSAIHNALFLAITTARKSIHLTTPYFIPDTAIMSALTVAAFRGVEVKILLPSKSDAPIVKAASRSYYTSLLESGVRIYEYQPAILHSKMLTIDNRLTILGSANMDIRSFRLNFELNLMVLGEEFAAQAEALFASDIRQSEEISLKQFSQRSQGSMVWENACRLLSPIL